MEIDIPLKPGTVPVRHAPSRLGPEAKEFVRNFTSTLLARGVIVKSDSPWGARSLVVAKKDGSLRLVIDYRGLNECIADTTGGIPPPRIESILEAVAEAAYNEDIRNLATGDVPLPENNIKEIKGPPRKPMFWSVIDLAAGFYALPIKPESQPQTAFLTPDGQLFHWTRLPQGVSTGPSHMIRLMEEAMQGLSWHIAASYLDDTIIWASSYEEMLERIDLVLERFCSAGLSAKASKTILMACGSSRRMC